MRGGKKVPVADRFWTKVSKSEGCWLWQGSKSVQGYARIWDNGSLRSAHRVAYELAYGPIPTGASVDHICRNKGCVKPGHLRAVTHKQNLENLSPRSQARNPSGVRGVTVCPKTGRWRVRVGHNGRDHDGGRFDTVEEAAEAARALRLKLYTHNDADRMPTA